MRTVPKPGRFATHLGLLLLIFSLELVAITARFQVPTLFLPRASIPIGWTTEALFFSKELWRAGLWISGACLVALSPNLRAILCDLRHRSSGHQWWPWAFFHSLAFAGFLTVTDYLFARPTDPARISALPVAAWLGIGSTALVLWLLCLAPSHFWRWLVRKHAIGIFCGVVLGIGAWVVQGMLVRQEAPLAQQELWNVLAIPTLQIVYSLLRWGYSDLVYDPARLLVGTHDFPVEVSYACSGIEGVSLITLFLAIYLYLFRKELRFPQALWLFPIAIVAIWLANAVRIAALIMVGTNLSPEVALAGFHAQAGWITFTLIAAGLIALTHKVRFFVAIHPQAHGISDHHSLAAALLLPFLVLMGASMLTTAASSGFDTLYPVRILGAGAALWYFRKSYASLGWTGSWEALGIGVAVFLLWLLLEPTTDDAAPSLVQHIKNLPTWAASLWLVFRILGSVVIVPFAEELAFRGYLLRKLVADDFRSVSFSKVTLLSVLVSSALFGLLHQRWLAGTLAGIGYALAIYRRGCLGDAVLAHVTSNALIAFSVLALGKWSLWT